MLTRRTCSLLLALSVLVAAGPAHAGQRSTSYAFLVGCGKYRKTEFRELPFTGNDILGVRNALLATGFLPANVFALYDQTAEPQRYLPTRANILHEFELLLDGMRPEDTLVVALSGHGLQFKGDPVSYFVPVDGKATDKNTLIALDGPGGLYDKLKACKAKKKLLVVNACRNAPTVSLDFAAEKLELADEDRDQVPEGIAAIYSCRAGQKSYYDPDRKIALFYEHFIRAWQGEYAGGKPVTLEHVFAEVVARTKADAHRVLQVAQVPQVKRDDLAGEWVVPPAPLSAGRRLLHQGRPGEALPLLEKAVAAMPASAAARVARGMAYLRTGRYGEALADFREAARLEPGNPEAALQLGFMRFQGYGVVAVDRVEGARLARVAAERGVAEAMATLGYDYLSGQGVARDDAEALRWNRKAAELGEPIGMFGLAEAYFRGAGVAKDEAQADRWYRAAWQTMQQTGSRRPVDCFILGVMYNYGRGVAQNYTEAARWYRQAAEQHFPAAMNTYGWVLINGTGPARNDAEAFRWFKKAAEAGEELAMHSVGWAYANGRGVPRNDAEAFRWYRQAAAMGVVVAIFDLGEMYANGRGVAADRNEAIRLYRQAAQMGNEAARQALKRLKAE